LISKREKKEIPNTTTVPTMGKFMASFVLLKTNVRTHNRSDIGGGSISSPFEEITEKAFGSFFGFFFLCFFPFDYQHSPAAVSSFSSLPTRPINSIDQVLSTWNKYSPNRRRRPRAVLIEDAI
jgi:hypothetical protein